MGAVGKRLGASGDRLVGVRDDVDVRDDLHLLVGAHRVRPLAESSTTCAAAVLDEEAMLLNGMEAVDAENVGRRECTALKGSVQRF